MKAWNNNNSRSFRSVLLCNGSKSCKGNKQGDDESDGIGPGSARFPESSSACSGELSFSAKQGLEPALCSSMNGRITIMCSKDTYACCNPHKPAGLDRV